MYARETYGYHVPGSHNGEGYILDGYMNVLYPSKYSNDIIWVSLALVGKDDGVGIEFRR